MSFESIKLKIHNDYKKLQNLYNELLNVLFPIVENKIELEELIIEEIKQLNEFEIIVLDFLDLFNDLGQNIIKEINLNSDQFEPIVPHELQERIPRNFEHLFFRKDRGLILIVDKFGRIIEPDNDTQNNERQIINQLTENNKRQINNQSIENKFSKEIIRAFKIIYKIIKLICKYYFNALSAFALLVPITQEEFEEILQELVDFLNQNIQEFEFIGLFKFANKLRRFRDKFVVKFRNFFGLN